MTTPYYAPRTTLPIARQAECVAFAGHNGRGYWHYLARFSDITAFAMKGWPDPLKQMDLDAGLVDAAATLALIAELAELRGDRAVILGLQAAIEQERAKKAANARAR